MTLLGCLAEEVYFAVVRVRHGEPAQLSRLWPAAVAHYHWAEAMERAKRATPVPLTPAEMQSIDAAIRDTGKSMTTAELRESLGLDWKERP